MLIDFSVVIPTFRRTGELMEALASVLGQTGVTLEVTVVDD
jgi:glycosyltransferase involved in cell wall biosynthesis